MPNDTFMGVWITLDRSIPIVCTTANQDTANFALAMFYQTNSVLPVFTEPARVSIRFCFYGVPIQPKIEIETVLS